jgi:hypothetical protein
MLHSTVTLPFRSADHFLSNGTKLQHKCESQYIFPGEGPCMHQLKGKGKAVPLQAWSGPQGSKKLRSPDFMTTAQDGGKVVSLTHLLPLPPGNTPGTHFC